MKTRAVDRVRRNTAKLARRAAELEELADKIKCDLDELHDGKAPFKPKPPPRCAESLDVKPLDKGFEARINGGEPHPLSPLLGYLLIILADSSTGFSSDGNIGWKTMDAVRVALGKAHTRKVSKRMLATALWRLKCELNRDADLIQTRKGRRLIRFALRRKVSQLAVITADIT